ncbi:MAG TPA: hypothetical protein VNT79_15640 [Phycisphaerae bacterium]|nr:hypothetical protein [Phycisphaerae bacterium]
MKGQKIITRLTKEIRGWCRDVHHQIERDSGYLQQDLLNPEPTSFNNIASSLDGLTICWGRLGYMAILDGDAGGWTFIHRSALYHYWTLRINLRLYSASWGTDPTRRTGAYDSISTLCAHLYCYGVLTGLDPIASTSANALLAIETDGRLQNPQFWPVRRYEPFVLALHMLDQGKLLPQSIQERDFGVYDAILRNWVSGDDVASALTDACEYHCQNMDSRDADWHQEFRQTPFELIPIEILAIRRLRARQQLATPDIKHPLMESRLADFDAKGAGVEDDTIQDVRKAMIKVFGED